MADNKKPQEVETNALDKIKQKRGLIIGVIAAIIVVVGGVFTFRSCNQQKNDKANAVLVPAQLARVQSLGDSAAVATWEAEMTKVISMGGEPAETARLLLAAQQYKDGKYTEAIKQLQEADPGSDIFEAGRNLLMGDCYVNQDKLDDALKCYDKAIDEADGNTQIIPFVLIKKAHVYEAKNDFAKAQEAYNTIYTDYPEYAVTTGINVTEYRERAATQAEK